MKKFILAALCLLTPFSSMLAFHGGEDHQIPEQIWNDASDSKGVWISIGKDALSAVRNEFEKRNWMLISDEDPNNDKVVLMYVTERQLVQISQLMHVTTGRCGGFMAHDSYDAAIASGLREVHQVESKAALTYTLDRATQVNTVIGGLSKANIVSTIQSLSSYTTRYYTNQAAVDAANWLKTKWTAMAAGRSDISVTLVSHAFLMPSVVMTISGAYQPQDIVVIGGHLDSINQSGTVAPGADDDASGIATFTEAMRAALAAGYVPARTVKIIAYAAEEVGLRGSADIAAAAAANLENVIGVLQLDMTNYKGSTQDIYLMTDYTNASQNAFVGSLIDTYTGATRGTSSCGYGCSDHASWHNRGFRASMPFESSMNQSNPNIHTANDTISQSGNDAVHALKFAKLAVAYMIELAKGGLNNDPGLDPGPVDNSGNTAIQLQNGETRGNLSGAASSQAQYYIVVPAGATNLVVTTSGGTGDLDLYVKRGAQATTSSYDKKSDGSSNAESVSFATTTAGNYYILLNGYAAYSGVSLNVRYTAAGGNVAPTAAYNFSVSGLTANFTDVSSDSDGSIASWSWNFGDSTSSTAQSPSHTYAAAGTYTVTLTVRDNGGASNSVSKSVTVTSSSCAPVNLTQTSLSGAKGTWKHYSITIPSGCTGTLTVNTSGGTGDADLYVRKTSQPTTSSYTYRSIKSGNTEAISAANPASGTWWVSVYAYSAYSGLTLTAKWQ